MSPDVAVIREKYRRHAATYDRVGLMSQGTRRLAIDLLDLRAGDVVLDAGCGTGLSFPLIEKAIGLEGRIIGFDASPEMLARARSHVRSNGWDNVILIESAAEDAVIPEPADAVLFHFTHDILRSPRALENLFRQVKPGARVAAAGEKWSNCWLVPVNFYVWLLARGYVSTFEGFQRPWSYLERFVPDLEVRTRIFGAVYVAWGVFSATAFGHAGEAEK